MDSVMLSPFLQKHAKKPPPLLRQLTRRYRSQPAILGVGEIAILFRLFLRLCLIEFGTLK